MPASNTTPETATRIISLPYSVTVPEADIETLDPGIDYLSTCDTDQRRAMWWKYTTRSSEYQISLTVDADGAGNYSPTVSLWTGTLGSLTQFRVTEGDEGNDFCDTLGGAWFLIPCQPSTTYYIQVTDANATLPLGNGLSLELRGGPRASVPAGSALISNDGDGYPAAVLDLDTGEILRYVPYPAGEFSDWLPTGEQAVQNGNANDSVAFLDAELDIVATVALSTLSGTAPMQVRGIKSNKNDTFLVLYSDSLNDYYAQSFDAVGSPLQNWALPAAADKWAVARDLSVLYYAGIGSGAGIHAYDLVNEMSLPDLYAGATGKFFSGSVNDGFVDADGNIYFGSSDYPLQANPVMLKFAPDGTPAGPFDLAEGDIGRFNHYADHPDGATFVVWGSPGLSLDPSTFQRRSLADGSLISETAPVPVAGGSAFGTDAYSISNSCPLLMLPTALPDLEATPTLPEPILVNSTPCCGDMVPRQSGETATGPVRKYVTPPVPVCAGGGTVPVP